MSENDLIFIEDRVRTFFELVQQERSGIRRLSRILKERLNQLRVRYESLRGKEELTGWEQWLLDNFYALEGHTKQSIGDLRGFVKKGAKAVRLFALFLHVLGNGKTALTTENIEAVLKSANTFDELTEQQFDFVYTALKCVLITMAAKATEDACPEEDRERLLSYAVIGLNEVYELDFDAITRRCSIVEGILSQDPSGVYAKMAEQSRRHYRCVTARIAEHCGIAESTVARDVLSCAQNATDERERHVGFYLLNHDPQRMSAKRRGIAVLVLAYTLPLIFCVFLWLKTHSVLLMLAAYLPMTEIVRILSVELLMRGIPAGHIPRMELKVGDAPKTVVAVSTLLPPAAKARELRTRLEQLYFSNSAENLVFCVLADFKEDKRPYNSQDDLNIGASRKVIERLNARYGSRFMLYVRRRTYNRTQNTYSGWERKRGAITEFIRFMKGGETSVACFAGDREALSGIRYLIALDSDTNLSFESANTLVSAAEHPLNRPVIGKHNIVTAGYGILVPCIGTDLASAKATDFTRIMAGAGGMSTYEQECCDFYQDAFGEAVFSGKGLIDIDTFHTVVGRRFPENAVLSHDILEGAFLRAGLVSDVEMTDGIPTNALSWFTRLHRWLRGDWQNIRFLGQSFCLNGVQRPNPISALSRYKLIDNLRRSLLSPTSLACVLLAAVSGLKTALLLCALAFFSAALSPFIGALRTITSGGRFALTQRYFARTLPRAFELFGQGLFAVVMTAQSAVITTDAICRTLWRMLVTKRGLLQWTTAAQGELKQVTFFGALRRSWISELIGLLLLVFAPRTHLIVKMFGMLFLLYVPLTVITARPAPEPKNTPSRAQREQLLSWCAQMFSFYEDYADEQNHWLPPDNVQLSPHEAVARRTSPTNIGMMLLSELAARDFHFIDSAGLYERLDRTLETIESLETRGGNLYNWYATDDLRVLPDNFVSAVDSGNYLCALVALKEGLYEYAPQEHRLYDLATRIEKLLANTDFSIFYNRNRKLLSIGIDRDGHLLRSHYDFLMSEARTAGYYAIASRQAQYKHWRALNRTMSRSGVYAGPVSWTGTMFEYFMPHLLLPVYEGSLLSEALHYALYCQKKRAQRAGVPWGISESGYFAFDEHLNYQYKAHGVQKLGVKQGLDRECVVAPYATFLTLPFDADGGMKNLKRLEAMGMTGRYGFYEAIDFTSSRTGAGGAVIRSYMAHHVGMSMAACANVLMDNIMQKRFMRDHAMRSAQEFLQEKIAKDTVVYDEMKLDEQVRHKPKHKERSVEIVSVSPLNPSGMLLTNGGMTHVFADTGVSWLRYADCDVTRRPDDPLMHGQGVLAVVKICGNTFSTAYAPFYQQGVDYSCVFSDTEAVYHAKKNGVELIQRFAVDRAAPLETCTLTIRNTTSLKAVAELLFYLEPVLSRYSEYAAHPAFSKLFVLGAKDAATDTINFSRRHRDGTDGLFLSVGFDKHYEYQYALKREDMTPYPEGMESLLYFDQKPFGGGTATPDACCALRMTITVPPRGEESVKLLIACAATLEESAGAIAQARERGRMEKALSPFMNDTMAGRLGMKLLPQILLGFPQNVQSETALAANTRGQDALWTLGISGDLPIVLYDWNVQPDTACLDAYVSLWNLMRLNRLEFNLCVLGTPPAKLPEAVKVIDPAKQDAAVLNVLYAAACHIAGAPVPPEPPVFRPAPVMHCVPLQIPEADDRFDVVGGAFINNRFYVDRVTPLPFSHILANQTFGCLLNDSSLGNTWWYNARECKLTPWRNDIATGFDGERLLLRTENGIFDLCRGARASFSPSNARFEGIADGIKTKLTVCVSETGSTKYLDLELENTAGNEVEIICAYYMEPVMGVSRNTAKYTRFDQSDGCLLMHNPYNVTVGCHAAVHVPDGYPSYTTSRTAFLSGDWSAREFLPNNDPIAGTIVRKKLPSHRRESIRFILAAAADRDAAIKLATARPLPPSGGAGRTIRIATPDEPLNRFINSFAPHQILAGRIWGRCAFYQCSGAYGFRDQLQDTGAYLLLNPSITKEQIVRCCAAQFEEGDVLHWWHDLPNVMRGVRTRFSDDLIWLPLTVCDYLDATGDQTLLDIQVHFCQGALLEEGEQERYMEVQPSETKASIFEHCVRALERAYNLGDKGIPKIGCGDWNDGFSNVGTQGRGQSVWLGMFLAIVLERFSKICELCGDSYRASVFSGQAAQLRDSIDRSCWDGRWYLRAFYDDGAPMGSHLSDECQIDLLSQSFAALSGMPDKGRVNTALDSTMERLVDNEGRIIKLFTPPFDKSAHNPGYIKAYPTGIRENGGQYTHGAIWLALAMLETGRLDEGWKLLDMLNPASRCAEAELARAYKTEPYYIAADIYTHSGAYGHGGWSIYTGAAAWYYRTVIEYLLGLHFKHGRLELSPKLPSAWSRFAVSVADNGGTLQIEVRRTGQASLRVDGAASQEIPLDGKNHEVVLTY